MKTLIFIVMLAVAAISQVHVNQYVVADTLGSQVSMTACQGWPNDVFSEWGNSILIGGYGGISDSNHSFITHIRKDSLFVKRCVIGFSTVCSLKCVSRAHEGYYASLFSVRSYSTGKIGYSLHVNEGWYWDLKKAPIIDPIGLNDYKIFHFSKTGDDFIGIGSQGVRPWLVMHDSNGDTIWSRYGSKRLGDELGSLSGASSLTHIETVSDGYLAVGTWKFFKDEVDQPWFVKFDFKGDTVWTRIGNYPRSAPATCCFEVQGSYVVVGKIIDPYDPPDWDRPFRPYISWYNSVGFISDTIYNIPVRNITVSKVLGGILIATDAFIGDDSLFMYSFDGIRKWGLSLASYGDTITSVFEINLGVYGVVGNKVGSDIDSWFIRVVDDSPVSCVAKYRKQVSMLKFAYPNPFKDILYFQGACSLYDVCGRKCLEVNKRRSFLTQNLPSGMYIIRQNNNSLKIFKK